MRAIAGRFSRLYLLGFLKAKNSTSQSYKRLGPGCVRLCRVETVYGLGCGAPWPAKDTFVGFGFIFTLQSMGNVGANIFRALCKRR